MSSPGRPLKVLIITQFYYPDVTACAFRMQETAALLAEMGCEVHVIAGEPHKGQIDGQIIDDGRIKVSRVPLLKYEGRGKWNYIAHYLSFMFGAIRAAGRHKGQKNPSVPRHSRHLARISSSCRPDQRRQFSFQSCKGY
ncbi:MAG TPA: hypothetical protein PKC25_05320 [Candidatus Rifleibacterium sp.]|nr:hypothetical protein [Candidatus Rifleibacterium sp.]